MTFEDVDLREKKKRKINSHYLCKFFEHKRKKTYTHIFSVLNFFVLRFFFLLTVTFLFSKQQLYQNSKHPFTGEFLSKMSEENSSTIINDSSGETKRRTNPSKRSVRKRRSLYIEPKPVCFIGQGNNAELWVENRFLKKCHFSFCFEKNWRYFKVHRLRKSAVQSWWL